MMWLARSTSDDGPDADPDWLHRTEGELYCRECRTMNRRLYPKPIDVVLQCVPPRTWSEGILFRVAIPVFRSDFAKLIVNECPRMVIGTCRLTNGQIVKDYVTMYREKWVLMRGDRATKTRVCHVCGSVWTDLVMVFPGRPAYLLRHQLSDESVYQDCSGSLLLQDNLVRRIDWSRFPDMRLQQVSVRDTPLDGKQLPGDPDWNHAID